jgi:Protein of unknown function (DUF3311)
LGCGIAMKYVWLGIPCLLALCAPLYNRLEPTVLGVPFFYWFQLVLVPVSAIGIYFADRSRRG